LEGDENAKINDFSPQVPLPIHFLALFETVSYIAVNVTFTVMPNSAGSSPGERTGCGANTLLRRELIDLKWRGERRFFILQVIFMDFRENAILMPIEV